MPPPPKKKMKMKKLQAPKNIYRDRIGLQADNNVNKTCVLSFHN